MPHTVPMRRKTMPTNEKLYAIIRLYDDSIVKLSDIQKECLGIAVKEILQEGAIAKMQAGLASVINRKNAFGANEREFKPIEHNLEEFAYQLMREYQNFLNTDLIAQGGKNATSAESEIIGDEYALIREILLRLITVALSDEISSKEKSSGSNLFIEAMESFVTRILDSSNVTLNSGVRFSLAGNANWVSQFKSCLEIIDLKRLPQSTFTTAINYLDKVKYATMAQILVECKFPIKQADLKPGFINTTFLKYFEPSKTLNYLLDYSISHEGEKLLDCQENKITERLQAKKNIGIIRIKKLFQFLNETEILSGMLTKIDSILSVSGWVLLLSGKLNLNALVSSIYAHQLKCNLILDFNKSTIDKKDPLCQALVSNQITSGAGITAVVPRICAQIAQLGSINNHKIIVQQLEDNIQLFGKFEKSLGIKIINDSPAILLTTQQVGSGPKVLPLEGSKKTYEKSSEVAETRKIHDSDTDSYEEPSTCFAVSLFEKPNKKEKAPSEKSDSAKEKPPNSFKLNCDVRSPSIVPIPYKSSWKFWNGELIKGGLESHYYTYFYFFTCVSIERKEDELRLAASQGRIGTVTHLIEKKGISINGRGTAYSTCSIVQRLDDRTPLMLAIRFQRPEVAEYLIKMLVDNRHKEDLNLVDGWGYTALDYAIYTNQDNLKKLLEDNGAKIAKDLKAEGEGSVKSDIESPQTHLGQSNNLNFRQ
jgi:hypothetical protein